jgi:hypothetical protein
MKKILTLLTLSCFMAQATQLPKLDAFLELPAVNESLELTKDAQAQNLTKPLRYAVDTDISNVYIKGEKSQGGQWDLIDADTWVWRLMVHSENAKTLDFGLFDFYLPPTAELRFYDWSGELAKGPFTDQKNKPHKQLWPGPLLGDIATVELKVSAKYKEFVSFSINKITRGYRNIWPDLNFLPKAANHKFWSSDTDTNLKSGSCNVDVICEDGDGWRDQINAVARYTRSGAFLCTGQMLNNTAQDGKPYFLTANHCGFNSSNASSINLWWNYQSSQCRTPGSSSSGSPISTSGFNDTQSGSSFKASYATSDFALLELDNMPPNSYGVYYSGWDARDLAPSSATGIHHPSGHAKRISFENNPLSITGYSQSTMGIASHLRVADWDSGTTEGGSSGSGIWNSQKQLVGQLHGGAAACGNNSPDWYGRLYRSWDGGGTSNSRLKDWLDPTNSGVQTLQGLGECSSISASIGHSTADEAVGEAQNFSATVSGGSAPYTYSWDVNEDGFSDGASSTIRSTYAKEFVGNVTLSIVDNEGCTGSATKAVVIRAPEVNLLSANAPTQVCGNNDAYVDPGERWQVPVTFQNNGFKTANNAYALFEKKASSGTLDIVSNDSYGNSIADCDKQFIDISNTGTILSLTPSNPDFPANDDGVGRVNLSQSFNFYGKTISSLSLSTNGYISTDSQANGSDWSNDCPLPATPSSDSFNARIIPLHSDLIVTNILHQHFNTCPRASVLGDDLSCDVFMYQGVNFYQQNVNFDFQAILYPTVNQWVYQYNGTGFDGSISSTGIQNDNATDGTSYSCNTPNSISSQQAVCVFHKDNQPSINVDASYIFLETPALDLGNLSVSSQKSGAVEFSIPQTATCGSDVVIDYQAAVYDSGFNQENSNILNLQLGNNNQCNISTNCDVGSSNNVNPTNGLWYNSKRSGNGNDMYFNGNGLTYIQYTALPNRSPIWYITSQTAVDGNQYSNTVSKFSFSGGFVNSIATVEDIGTSLTTVLDSNNAIQTRTINGEFSAEKIKTFIFSNDNTTQQRTGLWYNPAESGWGQTVGTQGDKEVVINYLYDNNGQPYWVLGAGANVAVADIDMTYFNAFCPHCPATTVESFNVGTVRIDYDSSNRSGTLESMSVTVDNEEHPSQWDRNNMPLTLLTPPQDN